MWKGGGEEEGRGERGRGEVYPFECAWGVSDLFVPFVEEHGAAHGKHSPNQQPSTPSEDNQIKAIKRRRGCEGEGVRE